jgi:hypothetical protein
MRQGLTHHEELNYMFTSGRGRINVYNADGEAIAAFNLKVGTEIKDITKELLNGVRIPLNYASRNTFANDVHRPQQVPKPIVC